MRVLHFTSSKTAAAGGIATAVDALQRAQSATGLDVHWHAADESPRFGQTTGLERGARPLAPTVIHSHGLWLAPSRAARRLSQAGVPTVIAPHGMLDPWAWRHRRPLKQALWYASERATIRQAACLHALCVEEAAAIRQLGIQRPIVVIPNGIDLPVPGVAVPAPPWVSHIPEGDRVLLFLGRFHQKKGIGPLLEAWRQVSREYSSRDWWLVFVGYGDNGATAAKVAGAGLPRCRVYGPAFGAAKAACFSSASGFILPSFSEGLPMAVLEAWSYRLPSLISPFCNLPDAFAKEAAISVSPSVKGLVDALTQFFSASEPERERLGENARLLVEECYTWRRIVEQTKALYEWIVGGGSVPENLY